MSSAIDTTLGTSIISILGVTDGQNILWTECLHVCSFEHKFNCYRIYVKYYYTMTTVLIGYIQRAPEPQLPSRVGPGGPPVFNFTLAPLH